jgi:small subunit ribosomal protein S6
MVHYEVALILRAVGKEELSSVLRGMCTTLIQNGAILRKLENLGEKELPYKINSRKGRFTHGRYTHQ